MELDQKSTASHSNDHSRNSDLNANDGDIINRMEHPTFSSPESFSEVLEMIMVRDVNAGHEVSLPFLLLFFHTSYCPTYSFLPIYSSCPAPVHMSRLSCQFRNWCRYILVSV